MPYREPAEMEVLPPKKFCTKLVFTKMDRETLVVLTPFIVGILVGDAVTAVTSKDPVVPFMFFMVLAFILAVWGRKAWARREEVPGAHRAKIIYLFMDGPTPEESTAVIKCAVCGAAGFRHPNGECVYEKSVSP